MAKYLVGMTRHPLSLVGVAITTLSALLFLTLFGAGLVGLEGGPYLGILTFIFLPAGFIVGLFMIPLGIWLYRRRVRRASSAEAASMSLFPVVDLNNPSTRRRAAIITVATMVNLSILAVATFGGLEFMDSTTFCGEACHSVMYPEFNTYRESPHSRVKCVECHIGPGANWFVKSKLSGTWQVVAVAFDLFPRPIPAPVHNLRPARDTCEQCHWPTKFVGDRLRVITRYEEDEENTAMKTVLLLRVGGMAGRLSEGIHWHVDPANRIRYRSDESRETIYEVELTRPDGGVSTYIGPDGTGDDSETIGEWRVMDCVDCHNRPTHIYRMPGPEIDRLLEKGDISTSLPYIKREGLRVLKEEYSSQEEAKKEIPAMLRSYYADNYQDVLQTREEEVTAAANALLDIYLTNVYPAMGIKWGTYPNHIGHEEAPGCFRCHNDEHSTEDGDVISQDCETCHTLLAWEEEEPEILEQLKP